MRGRSDLTCIPYYCSTWRYRVLRPHLVCPNRITKALELFPKCVFCNLQGSEVEGLRKRLGWSKREMSRRLGIPWKTYQEVSTFKRSGKRSDIYSKVQELIEKVMEVPGKYITQEMVQELTLSPLDFFNKHIGHFPWEDGGRWPSPVWPEKAFLKASNGVGAKWSKGTIVEKEGYEMGIPTDL